MAKASRGVARGGRRFTLPFAVSTAIIAAVLAVQFGLIPIPGPANAVCSPPGEPTVVTDKADYAPSETAVIEGCSLEAYEGQTVTINITRPDGSVDSGTATVVAGHFTYSYLLNGIFGIYTVEVLDSGSNVIAATTFTDHTSGTVLIRDSDDAFFADSYTTDAFGVTLDISWTGTPDVTQARFLNDPTPEDACPAFVAEPWLPITEIGTTNTAVFPWTVTGDTVSGLRKVCSQTAYGPLGVPSGILSHEDIIFYRKPNVTLTQTCGLDVVIVMDNSGSISSGELVTEQAAINAIVTALMPETPTQMALVVFNTSASVVQPFTSSESTMTAAVSGVTGSGQFTNWDDGIRDGRTLLPNRAGYSDLVVVVSDGHPNRRGGHTDLSHTAGVSGAITETAAMGWAIAEANQAKTDGIRIVALGVGSDVSLNNLIGITGTTTHPPTAVSMAVDAYTADFTSFASTLATFAGETCPAFVNVHKVIDNDGNLGTTGDQSAGASWTFNCSAAPDTCSPASGDTNGSGDITFEIDPGGDDTATVTISEPGEAGFGFVAASCLKNGNPIGTPGAGQVSSIGPLASQDVVNCTFYNTPAAYLTVNKVCDPPADTGKFNLRIDGTTYATDASCGGSTGPVLVSPGAHVVSETAGTGTNLSNYDVVIGGACAPNGSVSLAAGESKTCTITNTRKPTLTVNKVCNPPADTGKFNLRIDGTVYAADALCGGTTGPVVVNVGAHVVSETAGTGTNLANYDVTIGGNCAANGSITLAAGENKTCTITNTRKATLTVNKICLPPGDPGLFNLRIDGTTYGADKPCGGTTGGVLLSAGAHTVSETAGTGTSLSNYEVAIGGDCASNGSITLAPGDNKTCTITNTRKPTLTVNKVCVPAGDPGLFNLKIDGTTYGADKPCGGSTGPILVSTGTHTVSETAGTGTNLGDYSMTIGGACAANGTITLGPAENKTCTITNEALGTIIIHKVAVPPTGVDFDYNCSFFGTFQLDDDGVNGNPLDDTKTFNGVIPGDYNCTESQEPGWLMEISCNDPDGETTVSPPTASIDVDGGETVECTFTNTFVPGEPVAVGGIMGLIDGGEPPASSGANLSGSLPFALFGLVLAAFAGATGVFAFARRRIR